LIYLIYVRILQKIKSISIPESDWKCIYNKLYKGAFGVVYLGLDENTKI
jgi:hypothetical protein